MKLLTKHKDYYDYLQGIYGIDEKIIYDRRAKHLEKPSNFLSDNYLEYTFAICNRLFILHYYKKKYYHTPEEILELNNILIKDNVVGILPESTKYNKKKVSTIEQATNYYKRHNRETIVNKVTRQPILIRVYCSGSFEFDTPITKIYNSYFGEYNKHEDAKWNIPILSEYGMAAFYPAEEIYQDISQFLGWLVNNPEIPNKQTDTEKIVTHGFDLKESFRHRK